MAEIVTLGETMVRLCPPAGEAIEGAMTFQVDLGGAESNVAVGLAALGIDVGWVSRLPENSMGQRVVYQIRGRGVDTSRVIWAEGERVGTYYIQLGRDPRPTNVIYDRADSAFSRIDPDEVDWPYVHEAEWLHLTGITPALGSGPYRTVERAIQEAHSHNTLVSFDVNYRSKLWSPEESSATLADFMRQVNIVQCGLRDATLLFKTLASGRDAAQALHDQFGPDLVLVTAGEDGGYAFDGSDHYHAPAIPVDTLDPVGSGDAFAAGFITGYREAGIEHGLAWGCATASLKRTHWGDMLWGNRDDVQAMLDGVKQGILR